MHTSSIHTKPEPKPKQGEKGFTLIELSIVLVIIGLIIGGILVGQDLIKAAEIRATLSQIEKYNTAVNTFRNKYNQIPGDFVAQQASAYGFTARGTHGAAANPVGGDGDGNGVLDGCAVGASPPTLGCETSLFWADLSQAGYIDSNSSLMIDQPAAMTTAAAVLAAFPNAKLGKGNIIFVGEQNATNYWYIGVVTATAAAAAGAGGAYTLPTAPQEGLSPNQAYNMDKKVDDGLPTTGIVTSVPLSGTTFNPANTFTPGTNASFTYCVTAGLAYNNTTTSGVADSPLCLMQYRFN